MMLAARRCNLNNNNITLLETAVNNNDYISFLRILLNNHELVVNKVYTPQTFSLIDPDLLTLAGFKTQYNRPIEFGPERVGNVIFKPFNEGASQNQGMGLYAQFEAGNNLGKLPSVTDHIALSLLPNCWALYQSQFGRLFGNRIFYPAVGYINTMRSGTYTPTETDYLYNPSYLSLPNHPAPGYRERASGALGGVGNYGYSWSSTVSGTYGMYLWFYSAGLYPSNTGGRACGFQVRCLQEL